MSLKEFSKSSLQPTKHSPLLSRIPSFCTPAIFAVFPDVVYVLDVFQEVSGFLLVLFFLVFVFRSAFLITVM
ncbi:hypothetical protein P280DRAFT_469958, partial [Massarina eburnea CBS 473.64]